jgi:hypothetical protein
VVEGREMGAERKEEEGGREDEGGLVEKYLDCSLEPIFRGFVRELLGMIER